MKIKYVEAMIGDPDVEISSSGNIGVAGVEEHLQAVSKLYPDSYAVVDLVERVECLVDEIHDHSCGADWTDDPPPLVPLSHPDPLKRQLEFLFLPGDEMAILRLSDLKALIANQREDTQEQSKVA